LRLPEIAVFVEQAASSPGACMPGSTLDRSWLRACEKIPNHPGHMGKPQGLRPNRDRIPSSASTRQLRLSAGVSCWTRGLAGRCRAYAAISGNGPSSACRAVFFLRILPSGPCFRFWSCRRNIDLILGNSTRGASITTSIVRSDSGHARAGRIHRRSFPLPGSPCGSPRTAFRHALRRQSLARQIATRAVPDGVFGLSCLGAGPSELQLLPLSI